MRPTWSCSGVRLKKLPHEHGDHDRDQIRQRAERGEDDERRAEDLVQCRVVAAGAVLGDELDQRARVAHVEHREVGGDRRGEHPQAVGRRAEVRDVERQDDQPQRGFDADCQVAGRDVARHRQGFVGIERGRGRSGGGHCAPFRQTITLTVSTRMVRSKTSDRCFM